METKSSDKNIVDPHHLSTVIIGKLMNIGAMLQKESNRLLLSFGLNHQQFSIFFEIGKACLESNEEQEGKVNQKDVVNRLMLERAHVSKVVKKLTTMDLISVEESEKDKRSSWLSITTHGKQVMEECRTVFNRWNQEWLEPLGENELQTIVDGLQKIQTIFKDKIEKQTNY